MQREIFGADEMARALGATAEHLSAAITRALNRTMRSLRFHASHATAEETKVKVSLLLQRLKFARAKAQSLEAKVDAFLFHMPAILLGVRKTRTGVRAGKLMFPHSFVVNLQRGRLSERVKIRRTSARLPIDEVSVRIVDAGSQALSELSEKVERDFLKNFEAELKYLLRAHA